MLTLLTFARHGAGNADDAFILMVYVRNLVEHGVIEWNLGEGPIDGCTSLLDLLVKAAAAHLGGGDVFGACLRATLASAVLGSWVALGIGAGAGRTRGERLALGSAAAGLVATSPPNADAAAYLLEGPLFVACVLALVAVAALPGAFSRLRLAGLVLAGWLVALARPEGVPLAGALLAAAGWQRRRELGQRAVALAVAVFGLGLLAYFAWRVSTFGSWAPNTYYAKTSASRWNELRDGAAYVGAYLATAAGAAALLPALLAPLALAVPAWRSARERACFALPALAALGMLLVVVASGGDVYPGGRFLNVPASLGVVALVLGCAWARGALRRGIVAATALLLALQGAQALAAPRDAFVYLAELLRSSGVDACERLLADRLRRAGVEDVGQTDFQRLKFIEPSLRVIDFSGLNDREIAHEPIDGPVGEGKFTLAAVLRRRPAVFVWGHAVWGPKPITRWTMREIADAPERARAVLVYREVRPPTPSERAELAASYAPAHGALCAATHGYFNFFVRRDVAPALERVGFVVGR